MIRDIFDPTAIQHELCFCTTFSSSSTLNLGHPHFLETWTLWGPGNLQWPRGPQPQALALQMNLMTWSVWTLATGPWGFLKVPHRLVWSLRWGQPVSHECPLERAVSPGPQGSLSRQPAAYPTKEPAGGKGTIGSTGYKVLVVFCCQYTVISFGWVSSSQMTWL